MDTADTLWNFLVSEGAGAVYIKYQGSQTTDNMPIFMERHATNPGGGWFVIDFIDPGAAGYPDRIDLGRWDIGNQKILAVTTAVPEPAPLAIAGLGLLSLGFFRRRN